LNKALNELAMTTSAAGTSHNPGLLEYRYIPGTGHFLLRVDKQAKLKES
jgi:hypothetical protein